MQNTSATQPDITSSADEDAVERRPPVQDVAASEGEAKRAKGPERDVVAIEREADRAKDFEDDVKADNILYLEDEEAKGAKLSPKTVLALAALMLLCVALAVVMGTPGIAHAKSYSMPRVSIQAQVDSDASLHVVEQRAFDFDGHFTAVWWNFDNLPANASVEVAGVSMGRANDAGEPVGEMTSLEKVAFSTEWRDAGGPGKPAWSYDLGRDTLYVFFDESDTTAVVQIDYTVLNAAQAYEDVADLYWKYVGSDWAETSENVTMTVALPVPEDTEVVPGDNVRAWGHGPLDGTVTVNANGTVAYQVPRVQAGQYAEAHVLFPRAWLTALSDEAAAAHKGQNRLEDVLAEEQNWADQANAQRVFSLGFIIGLAALCALLLAWALRAYFKYGKEHEPDFTGEYWRDVPAVGVHPAVIGRLWRWDRESPDDFTATLMHLAHIGAIRLDSGSYPAKPGSSKMVADTYLTKLPAADAVTDPIDRAALDLLFGTIAGGADSLWLGTIKQYGEDHPQEYIDAMKAWQGQLSGITNRYDFFEAKGNRYQTWLAAAAVLLVAAAIGIAIVMENFIPLLFMVPTAIALFVIANYMPRRSVPGNNLAARSKALRNWLRDFSTLDERPPTDVKVWGEFMVYAYLFGVAQQAIKQLRETQPQLFEYDGSLGATYLPWWFWYSAGYTNAGVPMAAVGDTFGTALANTTSMAQAALSGASGGFSSGGGFGGGFSGGGGGGFGGGGGAR